MDNLFAGLPTSMPVELVSVLAENQHVRIERIVSTGHSSADDFWYDQHEHEWIIVLSGEAILQFDDEVQTVKLERGDHMVVQAHRRHRVQWTTPEEPTVWLAVFYKA